MAAYPLLPTKELLTKFAPFNPRRIKQPEFEALQRSIDEFGFVEPVIVNTKTNRIVGGHQRVRAAKALGVKEVPVMYVEMDEAREKALNVALNKISGEWDYDLLHELMEGLDESLRELTGFEDDELKRLLSDPFEDEDEPKPKGVKESRYTTGQLRILAHDFYPAQAEVVEDFLRMVDEHEGEAGGSGYD